MPTDQKPSKGPPTTSMDRIDTVAQYAEARNAVSIEFAEGLRKRHRDLAAKRLSSLKPATERLRVRATRKIAKQ